MTLKRMQPGRKLDLRFISLITGDLNQTDRTGQRFVEVVCFFANETDSMRRRETVLDRMLDQDVLCKQDRRDQ